MFAHIHTHTYIHTLYIHMWLCLCMYMSYMYVHICLQLHTYWYTYVTCLQSMHVSMHVHICLICMHMYCVCVCVCARVCPCLHGCVYMCASKGKFGKCITLPRYPANMLWMMNAIVIGKHIYPCYMRKTSYSPYDLSLITKHCDTIFKTKTPLLE